MSLTYRSGSEKHQVVTEYHSRTNQAALVIILKLW